MVSFGYQNKKEQTFDLKNNRALTILFSHIKKPDSMVESGFLFSYFSKLTPFQQNDPYFVQRL